MAHILPNRPQFADTFGAGLGSTLGNALSSLAQQKIQSLFPNQFVEAAKKAGIPEDAANFMQYLGPQERLAFFQRLQPGDFAQQGQQQAQPQQFAQQQMMGNQEQQQSPQMDQQSLAPILEKLNPTRSPQEQLLRDVALWQLSQQPQQQAQQQKVAPQQAAPQNAEQAAPTQQSPTGNPTRKLVDILSRPSPGQEVQERRHQEKLAQGDEKEQNKYILPKIEKQNAIAKEKREQDNVLKRIIAGRETGKVRNALLSQALKIAGIDYEGLKNKETLEQTKLTNYFLKGGASMFGGRVSNFQAQTILGSVPNILQDDEGAKWLANQMINSNQEDQARARVMRDVLKDNPHIKPIEFDAEVERRMEPLEQQFADDFINGATAFTTKTGPPSTSEKLPEASAYPGATYEDENTGKKYKSNGSKWIVV